MPAANCPGEPALASRRQLKKAMKEHFLAAYGKEWLPPDPLDRSGDMQFVNCCRQGLTKPKDWPRLIHMKRRNRLCLFPGNFVPIILFGKSPVLTACISNSIEGDWLRLVPVRVGPVPVSLRTPDRYVTVARDTQPLLRIDIYACGPDCFAFEEVITWRDSIIIGFGSHVHAVSLADRSVVTIVLGAYFCHLYAASDYVLIASGERLFRLEPDRSILWKSVALAIDGVVVHDLGPIFIRGEGEWDPPGGWKPFTVSTVDGEPAR